MLLLHGGQISEIRGVQGSTEKSGMGLTSPELQLDSIDNSGIKYGMEENKQAIEEVNSFTLRGH